MPQKDTLHVSPDCKGEVYISASFGFVTMDAASVHCRLSSHSKVITHNINERFQEGCFVHLCAYV